MSKIRIVFLGTPEFAVASLRALVEDEHFEIVGVVTQPDRPSGRKMQLHPSAVKNYCQASHLRVISPESVNTDVILLEIQKWGAEIAVVVAFGQILSSRFLNLFPLGAVNVHGSLLPLWRGAAPIQRAIEAGDCETGVALQKMVKKLDAGDVLGVRKIEIGPEMNSAELHDALAKLSGELLHVELMDYVRGNLMATPQDESKVTYAKKIEKSEAEIDWKKSGSDIHNKVRAFVMGPGTFTTFQGKKLKVHKTSLLPETQKFVNPITQLASGPNVEGSVLHAEGSECWVAAGNGDVVRLIEVQPESRNRMAIADFIKGYGLRAGDRFGIVE